MELAKKSIRYAKYYETPAKFHRAITGFFETVNQKHNTDLKKLLTLNFQFFENKINHLYPTN